jgi:BlaI family penicillinase repressor
MPNLAISPSELEVMKILWPDHPLTAAQVVAALGSQGWSESTVKTLLARLVKKGVLGTRAEKNRFFYTPLVDEAAFARARGTELAQTLGGGPAFPVMVQFLQTADLTPGEIAELKKLLEDKIHG